MNEFKKMLDGLYPKPQVAYDILPDNDIRECLYKKMVEDDIKNGMGESEAKNRPCHLVCPCKKCNPFTF